MLKFQALEWNQRIRTALSLALPALTAKLCLYTGATPDVNADAHNVSAYTLPLGANAQPKDVVLGVLHHHDADYDAVHVAPVEFYGDNANPDEIITGWFLAATPDDDTTSVLFAEEFTDPIALANALDAFTLGIIVKLPRRSDMVESTVTI